MAFGVPKTFDKKFSFLVDIPLYGDAAFTKCSGLEVEAAEIKQYEGGSLIPNKSPGRLDFKDITLERGVTTSRDSLRWFAMVALGPLQLEPIIKRIVTIRQLDRLGGTTKIWQLLGAWPKQFTAGEWDNTVDENVIEKVVISYDFFIRLL
jgi:phage tail-like protein